ncbi:MAG: polyphosphate kinase 1 [Treponema sp.]|jgi:polyphosphate kinase|nr:polyphosphate kinase 1 [Treponema sp.]
MEAVYFNRDISWIDFNSRVLEEGLRPGLLPLDRIRFLSIVSSNFDEFFMVRVAAMKRALRAGTVPDFSGLGPADMLRLTGEKVRSIIKGQYDCLREEVLPALAAGGLELVRSGSYSEAQKGYLESRFLRDVLPILTPLRVEDDKPLPSIGNLGVHVAFLLSGETGDEPIAIVRIPSALDRIVLFPAEDDGKTRWTLLDDIVITWGARLFPGYQVKEAMAFKVTRDADFSVDEKRDEDFLEAMEEVLVGRETSKPVRMTYSPGSARLRDELARRLELGPGDLYELDGPLDLRTLAELGSIRGFEHLKSAPAAIYRNPAFAEDEPLWDRINQGDVLLHLPYESFDPVIRFFQDAAGDPRVISIKTALYRTSGDSPIVKALEKAALNGKHVTAVVEIKARFDEGQNISWANRLEKAGVIVVYGLARLKVHAKISLIIRRERGGIRRYTHLSTGNYNDRTAKQYEDIGIFTSNDDIAFDASLVFNMITGYSMIQRTKNLIAAPIALKDSLLRRIEREAKRASQGYPGKILAKMNALADKDMIDALYRASQAGVRIFLNIRGVCMLVPGVPELSENIRVVSIVDHYLEHGRIFYFANGGAEELFLSSADWMTRNLERRVELMFPVIQEELKKQVHAILETYFRDNCQARLLNPDGSWTTLTPPPGEPPVRAQALFLDWAAAAERPWTSREEFIVRRSPPGDAP